MITSPSNPIVKNLRALALKKYRDESGHFIVEGARHVLLALENGWELDTLVLSPRAADDPDAQKIIKQKFNTVEVNDDILGRITNRDNAQALIGVFKQKFHDIGTVCAAKPGLWLGLEDIRDPGNLGTIIRTADAVGALGILLIGTPCDPWSPEAIRATTGSFARVPLISVRTDAFVAWRKEFKGQVIGTHLHQNAVDYRSTPADFPVLLLMGSEKDGLSSGVVSVCDALVKIPMVQGVESLNLAVSTGIMLYEIFRRKLP